MPLPSQLGRYSVEKEIGQGAMGRVFLGHDPAIDRRVALKTIHMPAGLAPAQKEEARARFMREVRAAGRLAHPHIVTVFDVGEDPVFGTFVAMEYVEGPTFEALISSGRLPPPRTVVSVVCQAADALHDAHRQGIVHRDIKPANLILVDERSVKIADFGLAKPEGAALTQDGAVVGTPYYMSPEQVKGGAVDGRSDLFSLAVVTYELLTGKRPFRGDAVSTVVYRILHEPPVAPDPGSLAAAEPVKAFLARGLAKDPGRRFPDGDAFARALREAFGAVPAGRPDPGAETPTRPRPGRSAPEPPAKAAPARRAAPGPPRGRKKPGQARKRPGRSAGRRRRGVSLAPLAAVFVVLAMVAWVFRDPLFDWGARQFGLSVPAGAPGAAQPGPPGAQVEEAPPGGGLPAAEQDADADEVGSGEGESGAQPSPGGGTGADPGRVAPAESAPGPAETPAPEASPPPPPAASRSVRLRSEPQGAMFSVAGRPLEGTVIPAPEEGESLLVEASLGCRQGERTISPADAGSELVVSLQPATRRVAIHSEPAGAAVSVDGERRGETPVTVELDACEAHDLTLSRRGYERLQKSLPLSEGVLDAPERIDLTLVALPQGTVVAPEPPYPVKMDLSGQRLRPGERVTLVADTYRFRVRSSELLLDEEVRVVVRKDREVVPKIEFPPLARLNVLAAPSNVELTIESAAGTRELGAPPLVDAKVVAGTYTVRCTFRHNGEKQEKTVTLNPGENPPIRFVAGQSGGAR